MSSRSRGDDRDDRSWGGRNDDRNTGRGGYSSRDRDDDDDRGSRQMSRGGGRGNQGHGGWLGASEGHAEAARRGWADRR